MSVSLDLSLTVMTVGLHYTTFKSLFSPFCGFFTLLLRPCVPYALTYAPVWIATRCSDWSTCTRVILLLCGGVNGLRAVVTEAQNWEKINIQIHYTFPIWGTVHEDPFTSTATNESLIAKYNRLSSGYFVDSTHVKLGWSKASEFCSQSVICSTRSPLKVA